jgi:hypothetical protein
MESTGGIGGAGNRIASIAAARVKISIFIFVFSSGSPN